MPDLGRWGVVDKMSEEYLAYSPYSFVGNNPISNLEVNGHYWIKIRQSQYVRNKTIYGIGINDYRKFQRNDNYSKIPFLGSGAGMSNLVAKGINSISGQDPSLSWGNGDTWSAASTLIGGGMGKFIRTFGSGDFAEAGASMIETYSEFTGIAGSLVSKPNMEELMVDLNLVFALDAEGVGYIEHQIDGTGHRTGFIDGFAFSDDFIDGLKDEIKSNNPDIKKGKLNRLLNQKISSYVEERRSQIKEEREKNEDE